MKVLLNVGGVSPTDPLLRAAAPEAVFVATPDEATLRREAVDAEVCWGGAHFGVLLEVARQLRWFASTSAGMERFIRQTHGRPDLLLTSGAGTYDVPIAEHVLALLFAVRRDLGHSVRASVEHQWTRRSRMRELRDSTLGIVGLGHIGQEVARLAAGLGLRVLGHRRRTGPPPPGVQQVFHGRAGLLEMLRQCDQVAVTAALTPATERLLDAEALDVLPPHAVIVNIGRGRLIDEAALIERLQSGRLAGAGLDVFETEPLPADSPLWDLPQVIVTAHNAGTSHRIEQRRLEHFAAQLRRWVAGEPLQSVVNREEGY